jgi:hypothetical protein
MDINEKIAQRRKERELQKNQEVNSQSEFGVEINPIGVGNSDRSSQPIDERIKAALSADAEKDLDIKRSAQKKIKNWEWFIIIIGLLFSLATMVESFVIGVAFLSILIWYFNSLIKSYTHEVLRERAAIIEAKNFLKNF